MAGVTKRERHARAEVWLERVGLAGLGRRDIAALSGGEAKRVALARTLIVEPLVVLLDEPLTGLDRELHDRLALDLAALLPRHRHHGPARHPRRERSHRHRRPHRLPSPKVEQMSRSSATIAPNFG